MYYYGYSFMLFILGLLSIFFGFSFMFYSMSMSYDLSICVLGGTEVFIGLMIDMLGLVFIGVVMIISSTLLVYSVAYMMMDSGSSRFIWLVLLFVISMIMMILSSNFIGLMLGWDGLGLSSYCLVVYYQNKLSVSSGMMTILMNRVGDVGLIASISWLCSFGSWGMLSCWGVGLFEMNMIVFFIMLAAITKSAQIPFSSWLPAAMSAPTPVSALVHSSTLVTAGIYLMIRVFWLFDSHNMLLGLIGFISIMSMFFSGLVATFENDLSSVVALSTLSQLGLMMFVVSSGYSDLAFFHLVVHAFFKSMLFLSVGKMIHDGGGMQDIRMLGGHVFMSPITGLGFIMSNMALCGFPFMSGFYSKDMLFENSVENFIGVFEIFVFMLSLMLTCFYSIRLFMKLVGSISVELNLMLYSERDLAYTTPICFLGLCSVVSGSFLGWMLFSNPPQYFIGLLGSLSPVIMLIGGGLFLGFILFKGGWFNGYIIEFLVSMLFMNSLFGTGFMSVVFPMGEKVYYISECGWVEEMSVVGGNKIIIMGLYFINLLQQMKYKSMFIVVLLLIIISLFGFN